MERSKAVETACGIMGAFAERTGLAPPAPFPRRYLWTDSFAVCNFLGLYQATAKEPYRDLALALVEQVHRVLARHRRDSSRTGWLSELPEEEGARHPTLGGLRIGKDLAERPPGAPFDERAEWDRDGQYYHYLTRWMSALHRVGLATGDPAFHRWARELATTAHARFTYGSSLGNGRRMYWKMSVDLTRPLVPSMGHHDPLDGLVTFAELQAGPSGGGPDLGAELAELTEMCRGRDWATDDPLGLGGLLVDILRIVRLAVHDAFGPPGLLEAVLDGAGRGLEAWARHDSLGLPPRHRLAFREFGLAIGVRATLAAGLVLEESKPCLHPALRARVEDLAQHADLADRIEGFWLEEANRSAATWTGHRDINEVMLATSLAPEGLLAG